MHEVVCVFFVLRGTPDALISYFCAALPYWKNESLQLMASRFLLENNINQMVLVNQTDDYVFHAASWMPWTYPWPTVNLEEHPCQLLLRSFDHSWK